MSENDQPQAQTALEHAHQALREKRFEDANRWALEAARLDPELEEPWLILAAFAPPKQAVVFVQHALDQNPSSPRAQQAMSWAQSRLPGAATPVKVPAPSVEQTAPHVVSPPLGRTAPHKVVQPVGATAPVKTTTAAAPAVVSPAPVPAPRPAAPAPAVVRRAPPTRRTHLWPVVAWTLAGLLVCGVLLAAVLIPLAGIVLASSNSAPRPVGMLDKPTLTATHPATQTLLPTFSLVPTLEPSPTAIPATETALPTEAPLPTEEPGPTPAPPGTIPVVVPTFIATLPPSQQQPYQPPVQPPGEPYQPEVPATGEEHWIDVNLSQQTASAYEGNTLVRTFIVSTGTAEHPTVTGQYRVYVKYQYADMAGPGYYLPNVPYVMYFYKGYGLHGTYWHNNFGTPMSHGCVNFSIPDAAWLYDFVSIGTLVNVHY